MITKLKFLSISILIFLLCMTTSCKKDWLDAKTDVSLTVPATPEDYLALIDNADGVFNSNKSGGFGLICSDDYYLTTNVLQGFGSDDYSNAYIWNTPALFPATTTTIVDWSGPYSQVFYANSVLEGIDKIKIDANNKSIIDNVRGCALFFRSFAFYEVASEFAKQYSPSTASTDLGIPLRLSSDFNELTVRNNLEDTYQRITSDVKKAIQLLPVTPAYKTRPSKSAAYAFLAKVYLSMQDYSQALLYSDSCIKIYQGALLDYNTINASVTYPMPKLNSETILYTSLPNHSPYLPISHIVDSTLYSLFATNDLRRTLFFRTNNGTIIFQGSYTQSVVPMFNGLALDEVLLIRAECLARANRKDEAMADLNTMLIKRWKTGTFVSLGATDADDALRKVLVERRKELCFRGRRWTDLKRLNKDDRFKVTLTRVINGQSYSLPPDDKRYVLPIPNSVIILTGIPQNPK